MLEKVIKGLECCLPMTTRNGLADCKQCPYDRKITLEGGVTECCHDLMADAIALLKAQAPRVLTLEEVVSAAGIPAWFEGRSKRTYTGWALVYDVQEGMGITGTRVGVTKPGHITIWPATELYGAKWRCWTSRPTDAQREATPWN